MPVRPSSSPDDKSASELSQNPGSASEKSPGQEASPPTSGSPDEQVKNALQKLQNGDLPPMQAVMKIRAIAEKHPRNVMAQMTLGAMSMQTSQFEKAVERFSKVLEVEPNNINALAQRGRAQAKLGDTASAISSLQRALDNSKGEQRPDLQQELNQLN